MTEGIQFWGSIGCIFFGTVMGFGLIPMAKTKTEKATELFDACSTDEMKVVYQLAKDTLLSKIEDEQKEYAEKLNNLQEDKQKINGS